MAPSTPAKPVVAWIRRLGWLLPLLLTVSLVALGGGQVVSAADSAAVRELVSADVVFARLEPDLRPILLAQLLPILLATLVALVLRGLTPRPWSRVAALALVVAFGLRYLIWRASLLPSLSPPWLVAVAGLTLAVEAMLLLTLVLPLLPGIGFDPGRRSRQADQLVASAAGAELKVEAWVHARAESPRLIRRALLASRRLGPSLVALTLLDSVGRPELQQLADAVGAHYLSVTAGEAEAALLDRALSASTADLVASFDADMVPLADFLTRTQGFFADERVALVQTPDEHFHNEVYNRNLGVDVVMPRDREFFFHYLEVVRDDCHAVVGCGRACLLRRSALVASGGFQAQRRQELRRPGTPLLAAGWEVIYLDETLSLSEAPRRFATYLQDRLAAMAAEAAILPFAGGPAPWTRSWGARLLLLHQHLALLLPIWRLLLILLPLGALLLEVPLIPAPLSPVLAHALPFLILLHTVPAWFTAGHQGQFWNGVIEALVAVPMLRRLLRSPAGDPAAEAGSRQSLDRHGMPLRRQSLSLSLSWPFLLLELVLVAVLLGRYGLPSLTLLSGSALPIQPGFIGEGALLVWNLYNGALLLICLLCSVDQPVLRQGDRVPLHRPVHLRLGEVESVGLTRDLSETGVAVALDGLLACRLGAQGLLSLEGQEPLCLPVQVVRCGQENGGSTIGLRFSSLSPDQETQLLSLLYSGGLGISMPPPLRLLPALSALLQGLTRAKPMILR